MPLAFSFDIERMPKHISFLIFVVGSASRRHDERLHIITWTFFGLVIRYQGYLFHQIQLDLNLDLASPLFNMPFGWGKAQ